MLTTMFYLFFCSTVFISTLSAFFFKKALLSSLVFLTCYWFLSMFMYLANTSRSSIIVSSVSRFWRRSFLLFWALEFFLFFIYVFLFLNCPVETEWFSDRTQLFWSVSTFFSTWLPQYLLLLLVYIFLRGNYSVCKSAAASIPTQLTLFLLLLLFVIEEFLQFGFIVVSISYDLESYSFLEKSWVCSNEKYPSLVIKQYTFLLSFLKFWHLVYIYSFILIDLYYSIFDSSYRPRQLKYSTTSMLILFVFTNIYALLSLKFFIQDFYLAPYSVFLVNADFLTWVCTF